MPNKPVPAAATGLPNIDRRGALAGSATLLATAAASALGVTPAPASGSSPLPKLIEAHRDAHARLDRAFDTQDELEDAERKDRCANPILVPLAVMSDGKAPVYFELLARSPKDIRQGIFDTHDNLRRLHCSGWACAMFPELSAAAEREIEASQERALRALADAEAEVEARKRNFGVTAAEEATSAAEGEEFQARLTLAVYVPRNAAEAAAKREYIENSPPFCDDPFVTTGARTVSSSSTQ